MDDQLEPIYTLSRSEYNQLKSNSDRYLWLRGGGIYSMPYDDNGMGPEYDLSEQEVDKVRLTV